MKSRILQKINRNGLLGLIAISTFAFASCSRSLTSLQNSKKMQNQEVLAKPTVKHETQIVARPQIESPSSEIIPQANAKSLSLTSPKPVMHDRLAKSYNLLASKLSPLKNKVINTFKTQASAINNLTKTANVTTAHKQEKNTMFGGMIRKAIICFIIALIFALFAALFFDSIGYVFYVIATIFFIVGVIYLLFGLLREM